jgi:cytochrome c
MAGWVAAALLLMTLCAAVRASSVGEESGDAARGKLLFEKRCGGCHSLERDKEGPRLGGVFGRKSASVETFAYSDALRKLEIRWDEPSLERWLTGPDAMAPGTDMDFQVESAEERKDIVRYLKLVSGKP